MRKRIAITVMGLLLVGGGATAALGAPKKSGLGNPPNSYGHCTANYNGNKNGWLNQPTGVPPAFQGMLLDAEAYEALHSNNDNESAGGVSAEARLDIYNYCIALSGDGGLGITPGGQGHGGPAPK